MFKAQQYHLMYLNCRYRKPPNGHGRPLCKPPCGYGKPSCGHGKPLSGHVNPPRKTSFREMLPNYY